MEFLIHGIRKKLSPEAIKNVRGVGWMVDREPPPSDGRPS